MDEIRFCCPCHFGLESVLKFEVTKLGVSEISVTDGRVCFSGRVEDIARANIRLATAERVLIELGSFRAESFEQLFEGVAAIPLERFIGRTDAFPVKGHCINSKLHSVPHCQSMIKKAACKRLERKYGIEWFEETGAVHQLQFQLMRDVCTLYLDTSGAGLHKRGYRKNSNAAPIKETLAAGIIDLARVRADSIVCDPMCGSGTLLIEAAYKALRVAPGLKRSFAAEKWQQIPEAIWKNERTAAIADIDHSGKFKGYGSDIDPLAIDLSVENARKAGVGSKLAFVERDIAEFKRRDSAITIANPPYGERLLEINSARELYKVMGDKLQPDRNHPAVIISPDEEFENYFGKRADKKRKLYNGMIKCDLYMYFK